MLDYKNVIEFLVAFDVRSGSSADIRCCLSNVRSAPQ
jgi:hypothetical protein